MSTIVRKKLSDIASAPQTDWERVDALTEQQLRDNASQDNDSFLADKAFWQEALLLAPLPHKERVTLCIDDDVLLWLKGLGKGYQTRINAILRHCMKANHT